MQEYTQIENIIGMIKTIKNAMKQFRVNAEDIENIQMAAEEINNILYHYGKLKFQKIYDLGRDNEYFSYIEEIERLINIWELSIKRRNGKSVDIRFWDIYERFKYVDEVIIFEQTKEKFLGLEEGIRIEYLSLPHRYTFLKNKIDITQDNFSLIREYVEMLSQNVEKYKWLYEHMADYRSKEVLNGIVEFWFSFDLNKLHLLTENIFKDYYDLDIVTADSNTVFVDCGAYTGDSVLDYIHTYGEYNKIYAYELTPGTYETLVNNLTGYSNIIPVNKGVSNQNSIMYVDDNKNGAGNRIKENGEVQVEVVTLDDDIKEPISLVKMDIEGAEKDAIFGMKKHILTDKPVLMISTYHLAGDIFDIPVMINEIRDDYTFYMRFNGHYGIWPCDYVLFAV